jgi:hypothetical protein
MNKLQKEEELKKSILFLIDTINSKGSILISNPAPLFPQTSLSSYTLEPSELGFIRTVSWLYTIYFEAGKENVKFISKKFHLYQIDIDEQAVKHKQSINFLRTSLQHDLFAETPHNQEIQLFCRVWYNEHCNRDYPKYDEDWRNCLLCLLKEAQLFFSAIGLFIDKVSQDEEYLDIIISQWKSRLSHYHPPNEFDRIIELVTADIGRKNLDPVKFREKNYSAWINELNLLNEYTFEIEARKMIERDILKDVKPVLPFNGKDIMDNFGIPPGKQVGELLKLGYSLLETHASESENLLEILRNEAIKKGLL